MLEEGVKKKEENYAICHQGRVLIAITVAEVARSREGPAPKSLDWDEIFKP